jgi:hypothetical protein
MTGAGGGMHVEMEVSADGGRIYLGSPGAISAGRAR